MSSSDQWDSSQPSTPEPDSMQPEVGAQDGGLPEVTSPETGPSEPAAPEATQPQAAAPDLAASAPSAPESFPASAPSAEAAPAAWGAEATTQGQEPGAQPPGGPYPTPGVPGHYPGPVPAPQHGQYPGQPPHGQYAAGYPPQHGQHGPQGYQPPQGQYGAPGPQPQGQYAQGHYGAPGPQAQHGQYPSHPQQGYYPQHGYGGHAPAKPRGKGGLIAIVTIAALVLGGLVWVLVAKPFEKKFEVSTVTPPTSADLAVDPDVMFQMSDDWQISISKVTLDPTARQLVSERYPEFEQSYENFWGLKMYGYLVEVTMQNIGKQKQDPRLAFLDLALQVGEDDWRAVDEYAMSNTQLFGITIGDDPTAEYLQPGESISLDYFLEIVSAGEPLDGSFWKATMQDGDYYVKFVSQ